MPAGSSAKYLSLTSDGIAWVPHITELDCKETGETLDETSAATEGYESWGDGVVGLHITVRGFHIISEGVMPSIGKGTIFDDVIAKGNSGQTTADYFAAEMIVSDPGRTFRVRGQIEFSFTLRSRGPFFRDGVLARTP